MIYGNVNNNLFEQQLAVLPAPLQSAVRFLKENDLAAHELGRFDINPDGFSMVMQVMDLNTAPRETLRPEIHHKNIDVQFLVSGGPEGAAYYNDDGSNIVDEDLLESPKDILFYKNNPDAAESTIYLATGTYVIYFPWDIHIPAVQIGDTSAAIRKIVIKVPMDSCFLN